MIDYDPAQSWTLLMAMRLTGSVFPKGLCWAVPNAICAALLHHLLRRYAADDDNDGVPDISEQMEGVNDIWAGYTFVLGFLVVFRNNQAYNRFWEGATLISQVRGEWFNAISSLFAFTSRKPHMADKVDEFRHLLVRLASMMYCAALQQVCDSHADDTVEILQTEGISRSHLEFLLKAHDQCEVLVQWVQQLIVESHDAGILDVPPPVLSRAFQELSRGIVTLINARKIRDIPFPFPYAQMLVCMLTVHWIVTPLLASLLIRTWWWAATTCFLVTGSFWCLMYIAMEIDQPFGADANDLPIKEMMKDYNRSLLSLLNSSAQKAPSFKLRAHTASPGFMQSKDAGLAFAGKRLEYLHPVRRTRIVSQRSEQSEDPLRPTPSDAFKLRPSIPEGTEPKEKSEEESSVTGRVEPEQAYSPVCRTRSGSEKSEPTLRSISLL